MVAVPPLPLSPSLPDKPVVRGKTTTKKKVVKKRIAINKPKHKTAMRYHPSTVEEVNRLLSNLALAQRAAVEKWLAEHPPRTAFPIDLAISAYCALKEEELPEYFERLKDTMDKDLWELLTEE